MTSTRSARSAKRNFYAVSQGYRTIARASVERSIRGYPSSPSSSPPPVIYRTLVARTHLAKIQGRDRYVGRWNQVQLLVAHLNGFRPGVTRGATGFIDVGSAGTAWGRMRKIGRTRRKVRCNRTSSREGCISPPLSLPPTASSFDFSRGNATATARDSGEL